MDERAFALEALWDDCLQIAEVNMLTGRTTFVKRREGFDRGDREGRDTIYDVMRCVAARGDVHPADLEIFRNLADRDMLTSLLNRQQRKVSANFRIRVRGQWTWITMEMIVPGSFDATAPKVLFCWRYADASASPEEEALRMVQHYFHKMLRVNLTEDSYEIIRTYDADQLPEGSERSLSGWMRRYAESGQVMREDMGEFLAFAELENMRRMLRSGGACIRCRYRRRMGGEYRWAALELLPTPEYSDERQTAMLYVRDIHDSYAQELQYQRDLEYTCLFDPLTGLGSRYGFETLNARLVQGGMSVGLLRADMIAQRQRNDREGYEAGDRALKAIAEALAESFGRDSCFRTSGDGFAVLVPGVPRGEFEKRAAALASRMDGGELPAAAMGWVWDESPESGRSLWTQAGARLRADLQRVEKRQQETEGR